MDFETRFAELKNAVEACETAAELNKLVREVRRAIDSGTLTFPACDGALDAFAKARRADWSAARACGRSYQDARIDRILRIKDSSGRAHARKMGGR